VLENERNHTSENSENSKTGRKKEKHLNSKLLVGGRLTFISVYITSSQP
jgi:hypothetical protein